MARPQRIEYAGAVYHVTARGNERRALCVDDGDRERSMRVPAKSVASRLLCDYGGLTQREVAAALGLRRGAAVSAPSRKLAEQVRSDPRLRKAIDAIAVPCKDARGQLSIRGGPFRLP